MTSIIMAIFKTRQLKSTYKLEKKNLKCQEKIIIWI